MRNIITHTLLLLLFFPLISNAEIKANIAKSEISPELITKNQILLEGFGKGSLAYGSINYERAFSKFHSFGVGFGFNPAEALRVGSKYKTGVIAVPAYFVLTPWSGQLRPYLTGGFNFQFGVGGSKKEEPDRSLVNGWFNRNGGDFGGILYQGPALMGGIGLEYKFVGDWLIRATGYGLYFMKSETVAPWGGMSIGKQF